MRWWCPAVGRSAVQAKRGVLPSNGARRTNRYVLRPTTDSIAVEWIASVVAPDVRDAMVAFGCRDVRCTREAGVLRHQTTSSIAAK